jgi:ATPase subunit of ABC transporter with duplicated ATPase domains
MSEVITAIAGVTGGVLGALAGGFTTFRIERSHQRFQRERDDAAEQRAREGEEAVMRGVARVWSKQLGDFRQVLHRSSYPTGEARWWPDEDDVPTEMSVDDMKRVAAKATNKQWQKIDFGLSHLRAVRATRARSMPNEPVLTLEQAQEVEEALREIAVAMKTLARLAKDRDPRFPYEAGRR